MPFPRDNSLFRISLASTFVVFAGGSAALGNTPASPAATLSINPPAANLLHPGDRLTFQIVEDGDPPIERTVNREGMIDLPYLGEMAVTGLTEKTLAARVKAELDENLYNSATVRISLQDRTDKATNRGRIFISGQVPHVGTVEIDKTEANTAGKVILANGGLSDFADTRKIKIFRTTASGEIKTQIVDLREVLDKGRLELDVPVFDGDLVVVGSKLINW